MELQNKTRHNYMTIKIVRTWKTELFWGENDIMGFFITAKGV